MRFATDIVAVNLRDYSHSPQLLTDLAHEGYELFNPEGHVFFRLHVHLKSEPVKATPPAAVAIDCDALAAAIVARLSAAPRSTPAGQDTAPPAGPDDGDDEEEYGPECGDEGRDDGPDD